MFSSQIFKYALLFFLLTFVVSSDERKVDSKNYKQPLIWLSASAPVDSYDEDEVLTDAEFRTHDQYQNYCVSKNGSDFVVFYDDTRAVEFTCEADYPIKWNFPYPEQWRSVHFSDVTSNNYLTSVFTPTDSEPTNVIFTIGIRISMSNIGFLSANLTCESANTKEDYNSTESSVYIFSKGYKLLEHENARLNVFAEDVLRLKFKSRRIRKSQQPPILLPCRPSFPELKVFLEKRISNSINESQPETWEQINLSAKHLTFDPKFGFTLQRDLFGNRIFGLYRCSALLDQENNSTYRSNSFVYVNVKEKLKDNSNVLFKPFGQNFHSVSNLQGNAVFSLNVSYNNKEERSLGVATCCTGIAGQPPVLHTLECNNPLQCKMLKEFYLLDVGWSSSRFGLSKNVTNDCKQDMTYYAKSVVVGCLGKTVSVVEHFVTLFHPMAANGPIANRSMRIIQAEEGENTVVNNSRQISLTHYKPMSLLKYVSTSEKIMIFVAQKHFSDKDWWESSDFGTRMYFYNDENIKKCSSQLTEGYVKEFFLFEEYDRDVYYVGESLNFLCFAPNYIYAHGGAQLRVVWKNGTKTMPSKFKQNSDLACAWQVQLTGNAEIFNRISKEVTSIIGNSLYASQDMTLVECWMAQSSTGEWDMISKSLQILPSVAPKFEEPLEETLYFYLGDEEQFLTCTVNGGLPQPKVEVTRDWSKVQINSAENSTNILNETSMFKEISKEGNLTVITIRFPTINHNNTQGVFHCTATNVNGTVKRTINVLVIEKPGIALPFSVGVAVVFLVVLIGVGIKHLRNRKVVQALVGRRN